MFLNESRSPEADAYREKDRVSNGYVMNYVRAWAWRPEVSQAFAQLRKDLIERTSLTAAEVALLTCATVRALGDSYCSLAWGAKLAGLNGAAAAAQVLRGGDASSSTARETALRQWAEQIVRDPNGTTAEQVSNLRSVGLSDREIFEATVHVAFRLAFASVNDALGALPDRELARIAPPEVRAAVTYGRPLAEPTP